MLMLLLLLLAPVAAAFFFQAEVVIRDRSPSRGLGDVYERQHIRHTAAGDSHNGLKTRLKNGKKHLKNVVLQVTVFQMFENVKNTRHIF